MSDRSGHICPECGAPKESGGSPTCDCARRAADELLETRSAEAAAAEDFDPLRIRPYVDLGVHTEGPTGSESGIGPEHEAAETHAAHETRETHEGRPGSDADADARGTLALPRQHPSSDDRTGSPEHQGRHEGPGSPGVGGDDHGDPGAPGDRGDHGAPRTDAAGPHPFDATARLPRATALPHPQDSRLSGDGSPTRPSAPFDFPGDPALSTRTDRAENPGRRRRLVLVGAGATAVVMAAAGFAGGLFSYESPSRNGAAPDDIRASVPDASVDEPSPSSPSSPSGSGSASASPTASPSGSASESASPSASGSPSASATPSPTTATSQEPSAENPVSTTRPPSVPPEKAEPVTLRRGDEGPEVLELQLRLKQLALYLGTADGTYDNRTENAVRNYQFTRGINGEQGTYGPQTRQRLETETSEP
ncbi:peptidoglycan-binding domain-containing protein [Streptomyces beigongshangae]|uniref:peptidoglycan-binding domain-containing protein n=1 Tax=Streptomyces beigongshangae TaxID=2841597 RepID=UPI001C85D08B|nr:peptidoglycan-binding domain-containing protein [Streptomyces sp. REN17]